MGEAICEKEFTDSQRKEFRKRLRNETKILMKLLEQRELDYTEKPNIGLEVEAWLLDKDYIPNPVNDEFLKRTKNPLLVEELSKFNFEINVDPEKLGDHCLSRIEKSLVETWNESISLASELDSFPSLIGIHPLVRTNSLDLDCMSKGARYEALNTELMRLRSGRAVEIDIKGNEHFQYTCEHVMMEAAATSIQVHIQANQEDSTRLFNSSLITSAPCVAVAANSPFLCGHDLWAETRIPLFEQSVKVASFRSKTGESVGRVTFGTGYLKKSLMELFIENLDGYSEIMPVLFDDPPEMLRHLRFHNGTLWRWNRPIIGIQKNGRIHFRLEQRAMASGPTIKDIVANMAFSIGLTLYYANQEKPPEESMTFTDCRNNFYEAAKNGLSAKVRWFGKEVSLSDLILTDLIPKAKKGLELAKIDKEEIRHYLDAIIYQRVLSGQNGANWQRSFVNCYGKDFQSLSQSYLENQMSELPVHKWKI